MNVAIILAGGTGTRFGSKTPKQYIKINDKEVIQYTIEAFEKSSLIHKIVIVVSDEYIKKISTINPDHVIVSGGNSRLSSSYRGLLASPKDSKKVLIHDAARPFVTQKIITSCIEGLDTYKAVVTSISATDTIIKSKSNEVDSIQNRDELYLNQTPQGFNYKTIMEAHKSNRKNVTDDISFLDLNKV